MTQRVAPNNQLPATHFIEVYKYFGVITTQDEKPDDIINLGFMLDTNTIAVFYIRENKLPTLHNFNK